MDKDMIPSKIEEMQDELNADAVRETANEVNDGAMDSWIMDNYETLVDCFLSDYNDEWKEFLKESWEEQK